MGDVLARYMRARGKNVLHPMGWDAFGLPAENAAMQRGVHPGAWTTPEHRGDEGPAQVDGPEPRLDARVRHLRPDYYRHQQKLFLDFLEAGLVDAQEVQGQLGPGRHDRARQRAGDRRPRLALGRRGRAARADPVVLQDLRLFRGAAAARSTGSTAGPTRCASCSATGSASPKACGCCSRSSAAARAPQPRSRSSRRGPTRSSARAFIALSPDHPLATELAANDAALDGVHRRVPSPAAPRPRRSRRPRRRGYRHRPLGEAPGASRARPCRSMSPTSC